MNRSMERATDPVHVLADFEEYDRHATVLTDRQALGRGHLVVAHQLFERPPSEERFLARDRRAQRAEYVGGNVVVGFDDEPRDGVAEDGDVDIASHRLGSGMRVAAPAGTWSRL